MDRIKARIKTLVLMWNRPAWAMLAAVFVYTIYGSLKGFGSTNFNYFAYLADAFNHGQFHLRLMPPDLHDLVIYDGKVFLYWFPMPAIMMMPLVAIFGVFLSDVVLTIVLGGVNACLLTVLLHQVKSKDIHRLEPLKQALLVIFFSFGTAYFTLAPYGKVWHLSQLVSIFFMLLAYLSTISFQGWKAFLFTGLALTGAMLTRSHLILIGIWPAFTLIQNHWGLRWKKLALLLALASLPIFLGAFFILYYNQARFGDPFELGLLHHQVAGFFAEDFEKYGLFNIVYLPKNLFYNFLYYPLPVRSAEWMMGGSLFLLSPVFFAVFFSFHDKKRILSQFVLVVTMVMVYLPSLMLMGTGWVTFGPRYLLDFVVPLMLLTAQGVERWPRRILAILCLISILHYAYGTILLRGI